MSNGISRVSHHFSQLPQIKIRGKVQDLGKVQFQDGKTHIIKVNDNTEIRITKKNKSDWKIDTLTLNGKPLTARITQRGATKSRVYDRTHKYKLDKTLEEFLADKFKLQGRKYVRTEIKQEKLTVSFTKPLEQINKKENENNIEFEKKELLNTQNVKKKELENEQNIENSKTNKPELKEKDKEKNKVENKKKKDIKDDSDEIKQDTKENKNNINENNTLSKKTDDVEDKKKEDSKQIQKDQNKKTQDDQMTQQKNLNTQDKDKDKDKDKEKMD